uniref:Uncharacterized protein n=3 Tax=Aegilops tauschii subsp. strangulata TaxID=200361 RepID=A0A452YFG7_AEGTS
TNRERGLLAKKNLTIQAALDRLVREPRPSRHSGVLHRRRDPRGAGHRTPRPPSLAGRHHPLPQQPCIARQRWVSASLLPSSKARNSPPLPDLFPSSKATSSPPLPDLTERGPGLATPVFDVARSGWGTRAEPPCRQSSSSPTEGGASDAQMAAMKQQAPESVQGRKEFLVEVLMLTVLSQPNFVSLVGFCA